MDTLIQEMAENFRWHQNQTVIEAFSLAELLDEAFVAQHLLRLTTDSGSPDKAHAASMTAKRVGYAAALIIYARIKHNVLVQAKDCFLLTVDEPSATPGWLPVYSFPLRSNASNQPLVEWITKELYAQTLLPIVEVLAKEKGISRAVLLENIFVYIKWVLLTKLHHPSLYQQLLKVPSRDYGSTKRHPIAFYDDAPESLRKTCCLSYRTQGNQKTCKTCPLQEKDRADPV